MNMTVSMAEAGIFFGFISPEMSTPELPERIVSDRSGVNVRQFSKYHQPTEAEYRKMLVATAKMKKLPIHIDDRSGRTFGQILAIVCGSKSREGMKVPFIDYWQRIIPGHGSDRRVPADTISRELQAAAQELGMPVIAACQLNRDIEKESVRKPRLSELRESGSIEQDADVVGMLYKPSVEDDGADELAQH